MCTGEPVWYPSPSVRRALLVCSWLLVLGTACERAETDAATVLPAAPATEAQGTLRWSLHAPSSGKPGLLHETTYRNGAGYAGFSDNDIRGFLDGRFQYGWNQPLQAHVRAGRRRSSPRYGETELFRILQRWSALELPRDVEVESAELTVQVEVGLERDIELLIYAVSGDWHPGRGGSRRDNSSPPEPGDVWWGARAHDETPWGMPGAGFRSDVHPAADTPGAALARATYEAGADELRFTGPGLARFVEERAREGLPVTLLFKVADRFEDEPDTLLYFYSGEHGDHRNPARRPQLTVRWRAPAVQASERALVLEPGATHRTGRIPVRGARLFAASFSPEPESDRVTLELRSGAEGAGASPWRRLLGPSPIEPGDTWVELRAIAAVEAVALGRSFETSFRDTWLPTGPPEEQIVHFLFRSPTGVVLERDAEYRGDYRFEVSIEPHELGRWEYGFTHHFEHDYESALGVFDVVPLERDGVVQALERLLAEAEAGEVEVGAGNVPRLGPRFWRLERALIGLETPESLASPEGRERFALLTRLHEVLGGRPAPEHPPLKPAKRDW